MIASKQLQRPQLVLVIDDQETNRDLLGIILGDTYEIMYASNGREGLDLIRKNAEQLSVVLLDLVMPEMDGFEVLSVVKGDSQIKQVPIIVLTSEKEAELKALRLGAADFITKPFDSHEVILARVTRVIELSEGRELISAAEHDNLTQLYNPSFFYEYANRIYHYHPDWKMDAIELNIEQFHSVNGLNGREFGDDVLRLLGDEIRAFLRGTVGLACRFGADQFGIYCMHLEDCQALLDRLQARVDQAFDHANIRLRMGITPWQEGVEPLLLFDRARAACNMVRRDCKTRLMVYDDNMLRKELLDRRLQNDLRKAVEEHQLQVYYQPKYNVQQAPPKLVSAEALIRWKHPELGMISPGAFIPLFESNGQIATVDHFVWAEAAKQVSQWRKKYGIALPVSVNVSRVDTFDPQLEEQLSKLIEEHDLDPSCLKLEITESAYTENASQIIALVNRLRERNFEIEMDDFGSGYSSLNMLSAMPLDVLKMDMKFIRNIERNPKDLRLVELVVGIAKLLGVPVVAEGVETEGQLALLKNAGCDLVQGYYFSRPLPAEEFEKLLQQELSRSQNSPS